MAHKAWKWNKRKYKVAEAIADGKPIVDIVKEFRVSRATIYRWLEYQEFQAYIDSLIFEYGLASKRERIAALKRAGDSLYNKIMAEIKNVPVNERTINTYLSNFIKILKQIAMEKEEFVTQTKVEQEIQQENKSEARVNVSSWSVEELLASSTTSERERLEKEFDKIGDEIIRRLTG